MHVGRPAPRRVRSESHDILGDVHYLSKYRVKRGLPGELIAQSGRRVVIGRYKFAYPS